MSSVSKRSSRRATPARRAAVPPTDARTASDVVEWTAREEEFLTTALAIVREVGYDRMTVDEVAARAHASKMTVYKRWSSKADLVVAAVSHGIGQVAVPPNTGALRTDLLALAALINEQLSVHAETLVGVLPEVRHNSNLRSVLERDFLNQRRALVRTVMSQAADRGEITAARVDDELWDLLPGYLVFRALLPTRPMTGETVTTLIDNILLPYLRRR